MWKYLLMILFLLPFPTLGQNNFIKWVNMPVDSSYIDDKTHLLTLRILGGRKFTNYSIGHWNGNRIQYESNDHYNMGFGFHYLFFGLNITFRMPLAIYAEDRYGKTKFFDLQTYIYMRKIVVDLYHQNYTGFYLENKTALSTVYPPEIYPKRPDLHARHTGMNAQYVFNPKKFSYRASFIQDEYQKKNAGSFLAGTGIHYSKVSADDPLIPGDIVFPDFFSGKNFRTAHAFNLSIHAGYAYTVVLKQHYFLSASLLLGIGMNVTELSDPSNGYRENGIQLHTGGQARLAAGYNSEKYYLGVQYINFTNRNNTPVAGTFQQYETGNIRFTFARRIMLGKTFRKHVKKLGDWIRQ